MVIFARFQFSRISRGKQIREFGNVAKNYYYYSATIVEIDNSWNIIPDFTKSHKITNSQKSKDAEITRSTVYEFLWPTFYHVYNGLCKFARKIAPPPGKGRNRITNGLLINCMIKWQISDVHVISSCIFTTDLFNPYNADFFCLNHGNQSFFSFFYCIKFNANFSCEFPV